jgi:predicted enzyme related to lactoylglutathione lyase
VIKRIVPNLNVPDAGTGHEFYIDLLGMEKELDLGWIVRFQAPGNQAALVSLVSGDASAPEDSVVTIAVSDVDDVYARAQRMGYEIVHPLTDEPWGIRRFLVRDPHGNVINIVRHRD